jgi:hypothetical protein
MSERQKKRGRPRVIEGKVVTTTISLDEDTHWRLRRLAVEQRRSYRDLIREALKAFLDAQPRGPRRVR